MIFRRRDLFLRLARGSELIASDAQPALGDVVTRCGPGIGFVLVPRSPLNSVQMPAKQNRGRLSSSANRTTSFFVFGFGSGAHSAKLFAGTRQRLSGFSQLRQCGDEVLRILVTGGPRPWPGAACPHRIRLALGPELVGLTSEHGRHVTRIAELLLQSFIGRNPATIREKLDACLAELLSRNAEPQAN
jgi:hypothetical protein